MDKASRIAKRLIQAKFSLNYDNITMDKSGIFVEIDGHLDYKSIADSFIDEGENLEQLADKFSKDLLSQKGNIEQLKDMDVTSISKDSYRVVHDENKNEMYLFLPMSAISTKATENREKATRSENSSRTGEIVSKIVSELEKFMKDKHTVPSFSEQNDGHVLKLFARKNSKKTEIDDYGVNFSIERTIGKRNDFMQSLVRLQIVYNGEMVYNKGFRTDIQYRDYKLVSTNRDNWGSFFPQGINNGMDDLKRNIQDLVDDMKKGDMNIVNAFRKDLTSDEVKKKILEDANEQSQFDT